MQNPSGTGRLVGKALMYHIATQEVCKTGMAILTCKMRMLRARDCLRAEVRDFLGARFRDCLGTGVGDCLLPGSSVTLKSDF